MAGSPTAPNAARRAWSGIRPRLIGVLLVPTIAALIFGTLRVQEAAAESSEAARAESLASALPGSFRLAVQLTIERESAGDTPDKKAAEIRADTDDAVAAWRRDAATVDYSDNEPLQDDLVEISETLDDLDGLRDELDDSEGQVDARTDYAATSARLLGLADRMPGLSDESLYDQSFALTNIPAAFDALDTERRLMTDALNAGTITDEQRTALGRAQAAWSDSTERFYRFTSSDTQATFDSVTKETADDGSRRAPMQAAVDEVVTTGKIQKAAMTPAEWDTAATQFLGQFEKVVVQGADDLAGDVATVKSDAQRDAVVGAVVTFLVLFAALGAATLAARSIILPLRRLRRAALDVARAELPNQVHKIETAEGPVDTSVVPIGIGRDDEIGEVAAAFDDVHSEAVRLAGEQAEMRANVNRMFMNLSRRSQNLVERQLRLIDVLEEGEQNPDDLANLFQLDHLATRMRRNDESLLVLAGGEASHGSREDVGVVDILRAASSEIEQYERVQIDSTDSGTIRGTVAGDMVHLLAELIENATNFSPPDTQVLVRTARAPDGRLTIGITDFGVGMTPAELEVANAKLRRTGRLDPDVARMMGLVVASRLAHRHGMRIDLQAAHPRGVIARVEVPESVFAHAGVSAPAQGRQAPPPAPPAPPAPMRQPPIAQTPPPAGWFDQTEPMPMDRSQGQGAAPANGTTRDSGALDASTTIGSGRPMPNNPPTRRDEPSAGTHDAAPPPADGGSAPDPLHDGPGGSPGDADMSPIFASLQSEWFMPSGTGQHRDTGGWRSPGDEGWRRAAEVSDQRDHEQPAVTPGGLPKRVPGQNLVPGAASDASTPPPQERTPPRSATGLSSFQQGVSRARNDDSSDTDPDQPEGMDHT